MFNLINILGQNTLPEQVEINKQNIAILADEVEKLGYQPKGVYDAETEYNHNDVVFYDNKLYVVTSDAAIVGVLPTNTTYWQQVTGDMRGPQGATGPQGPAGADGTDGVDGADTLWYKNNIFISTLEQFTALLNEASHNFSTAYFNRTPKVGDNFMVFVYLSPAKETLWLQYQVSAVSGGSTTAVYQNVSAKLTGAKGNKGDTGKSALVYGETIPFSRGESSTQLIEQALPFANFNRTPELNEDFIAILHDTLTLKDYIANVEVQTINSGSQVVSVCVASNIALITGADGQNGTNGTDGTNGKDALTTKYLFNNGSTTPVVNNTNQVSVASFNRTPVAGENYMYYCYTNDGKSYMCNVRVDYIATGYVYGTYLTVVETTGAQGASPAKLYLHYITYNHTSIANYNAKLTFSCINSNPNWENNDNNAGKLNDYLSQCGLNSVDNMLPVNGYIETEQANNVYKPLIGVYGATNSYRVYVYDKGDGTVGEISTNMGGLMTKTTVKLQ